MAPLSSFSSGFPPGTRQRGPGVCLSPDTLTPGSLPHPKVKQPSTVRKWHLDSEDEDVWDLAALRINTVI